MKDTKLKKDTVKTAKEDPLAGFNCVENGELDCENLTLEELNKVMDGMKAAMRRDYQEMFQKAGLLEAIQKMIELVDLGLLPFSALYIDFNNFIIVYSGGSGMGRLLDPSMGLKPYANDEVAVCVHLGDFLKKYPAWILRR